MMNGMKRWTRRLLGLIVLGGAVTWVLWTPALAVGEDEACECCPADAAEHDEHGEHDECDEHAECDHDERDDEHDEHAECDHDERDDEHDDCDHDEHDAGGLRFSEDQRVRFGIVLQQAGPGSLSSEVSLPGEITFNEDRVAHIVPRVAGIAKDVRVKLGADVSKGETLAVLDSVELASAKLDYISAFTEVGCCKLVLPRTESIHDNVMSMLDLLKTSPDLEQLRVVGEGEMGRYRSELIGAYADLTFSRTAYEREQQLAAKKISSRDDFLAAERAFKKAQAHFDGTRDSVAFAVRQELLEVQRDQTLAEFELKAAEQKLLMLGLSAQEIAAVGSTPVADAASPQSERHACPDPNCEACRKKKSAAQAVPVGAVAAVDPGLGVFAVRAPFAGAVVEKHIAFGERVANDSDIFTIADTSSVWVNLTVYAKNLSAVRQGQTVVLKTDHNDMHTEGRIEMVTPFADPATRSATARVVVDNADERWLPGTFVTGYVRVSVRDLGVVVSREAVQNIDGENVVFVEHEGAFETVPVTLGHRDRTHVEITDGLEPGTPYVEEGAFHLKAATVTSNLDPHAGHGH
jgi:cobalt-zinc-cadmium efflux system membrane fusion protein